MNGVMSVYCLKDGLKEVQERLNAQKKLLKGCTREIGEAHAEKSQLVKDMNNMQLQVQELEHKVSKCNKDSNDAAKLVCDLFIIRPTPVQWPLFQDNLVNLGCTIPPQFYFSARQ